MSDYGNPPQDPNAQPNPYGQPQPNAYGQQAGYGQPAYAAGSAGYANWGKRVGAYLVDAILTSLVGFPLWIGYGMLVASAETTTAADGTVTTSTDAGGTVALLMFVGALMSLGFFIWNTCMRQGRTGYSIGKGALGIKLIGEQDGQPIGGLMAFVRYLAHIIDSLPCYLGYLWPIWDAKRQTFSDKIMKTVVINQPKG